MLNVRELDFGNVFLIHFSSPMQWKCYSTSLSYLCSQIQTVSDNFIYLCSNKSILHHLAIRSDLPAVFQNRYSIIFHQFTRDGFGGGSHWTKEQYLSMIWIVLFCFSYVRQASCLRANTVIPSWCMGMESSTEAVKDFICQQLPQLRFLFQPCNQIFRSQRSRFGVLFNQSNGFKGNWLSGGTA